MNQSKIGTAILNLFENGLRYDRQRTGILRYGTCPFISRMLNRMGFTTPKEHAAWPPQSAAIYYRRHFGEKDPRFKA